MGRRGGQKIGYYIRKKLDSDIYKRYLNHTKTSNLFSIPEMLVCKFYGSTDHLLDVALDNRSMSLSLNTV